MSAALPTLALPPSARPRDDRPERSQHQQTGRWLKGSCKTQTFSES